MTSNQPWWFGAGLAALALGALGTAAWVFSVDTDAVEPVREPIARAASEEVTEPPEAESQRPRRRRRARTEGGSLRAKKVERAERPPRPPREERERVLEPEELMWARSEFRDQRLTDMNERLDRYAATQGWDEELTEEVRIVMTDTIHGITDQLLSVDAGEVEWPEMRADMRAFREEQARVVEELLGPEAFKRFTGEMGFARFESEAPVEGRVRMRRRGRRAAKR